MTSLALTQSDYARRRGVSRQAVSKAVKDGRIVLTRDGKVPVAEADAALGPPGGNSGPPSGHPRPTPKATPSHPAPGRRPPAEGLPRPGTLGHSKAVKEIYAARLARLEYEKQVGTLIKAEDARLAALNTGRRAREALMNLPDRLAPSLAMQEATEVHRILAEEVRRICEEVGRWGAKT